MLAEISLGHAAILASVAAAGFAAGCLYSRRAEQCKRIVHDHMRAHRSIRKLKQEKPVSRELLESCLAVAMRSSNNGNMQTSAAIITRDPATKRQLALIHDNQGIARAAATVTFCVDWSLMSRWCALKGADGRAQA